MGISLCTRRVCRRPVRSVDGTGNSAPRRVQNQRKSLMANIAKSTKRAIKRVTNAGRDALINRSPPWMQRAFGPAATYLDMLFVDHGIFRLIYLNQHRLHDKAWRSAQPAPHQIAAFARNGIKTVVNLRGERVCGSYWLEQAACKKYGLRLENYQVRSRAAPTRQEVMGARDLFERIEYPMVMHCKSGADRAGLMSVLYLHFHEGLPIEEAKRALSLKFGHIRQADTGVLDYFFERYLADNAKVPMSFVTWLETVYDPVELLASFKSQGWANGLVNVVLRRE